MVKSTAPVGTGARIRAFLDDAGPRAAGHASNPEFTAEGRVVSDFQHPDRIVIGADRETARLVEELHEGIDGPVVTMGVESAELTKLGSNAALMTRISFINELADIWELTGADITDVSAEIGPHFLQGRDRLRR